jgi:hypothetical protein
LLRLDNVARRLAITLLAQQQPKRTSASHPRNATRCSKRIRPAHPESSSGQRTGVQLRAPEGASATDKPVCCNALLAGAVGSVSFCVNQWQQPRREFSK